MSLEGQVDQTCSTNQTNWDLEFDSLEEDIQQDKPLENFFDLEQFQMNMLAELFPEDEESQQNLDFELDINHTETNVYQMQQINNWGAFTELQQTPNHTQTSQSFIQLQPIRSYQPQTNTQQYLSTNCSNSNSGSCVTNSFTYGDSKLDCIEVPQLSYDMLQPLPVVCRPQDTQMKSQSGSTKRKKPEVDLSTISDLEELRRQKRLMKNRRTAANSRAKKRQELEELQSELAKAVTLHNEKVYMIRKLKSCCDSLQQQCEQQQKTIDIYEKQHAIQEQELKAARNLLASHGIDAMSGETRCKAMQPSPAGSVDGSAVLVLKQVPVVLDRSQGISIPFQTFRLEQKSPPLNSFGCGLQKFAFSCMSASRWVEFCFLLQLVQFLLYCGSKFAEQYVEQKRILFYHVYNLWGGFVDVLNQVGQQRNLSVLFDGGLDLGYRLSYKKLQRQSIKRVRRTNIFRFLRSFRSGYLEWIFRISQWLIKVNDCQIRILDGRFWVWWQSKIKYGLCCLF
eukprot:TRINITY_DN7062_c0_g1_i6.p1 TRINITY_DN7062_c0_g1~~TRINITY_DN7062_c0_g1_i6.p1  ORF type:complete len:509 (-),score=49.91 TRINITY_DN7062_c0_g1_i6:118-1644(-)